jgi:hypothetical protein
MSMNFEWIVSPDVIAKGLQDYGKKAMIAIQATATKWGQDIQDAARTNARWEDRTGNARGGLFFAVDGFGLEPITGTVKPDLWADAFLVQDSQGKKWEVNRGREDVTIESGDEDTLIITLGHTVFYGKFLETSNGENYAIIMSTMESNLPELESLVEGIFRG